MHFLIRETLSFNLMNVAACYPVGTTISKTSSLFTALLQHYLSTKKYICRLKNIYLPTKNIFVDLKIFVD